MPTSDQLAIQTKQKQLDSLELIQKQQQLIEELESERQSLLAAKARDLVREGQEFLEASNVNSLSGSGIVPSYSE